MASLVWYVSAHGFGHAVRSGLVLAELRRRAPRLPIHVRAAAPAWLFPADVGYERVCTDLGIVQQDSVTEDLDATLARAAVPGRLSGTAGPGAVVPARRRRRASRGRRAAARLRRGRRRGCAERRAREFLLGLGLRQLRQRAPGLRGPRRGGPRRLLPGGALAAAAVSRRPGRLPAYRGHPARSTPGRGRARR